MMIRDLIKELERFEADAEVRLSNGETVELVYRCEPEILSDNSSYPVVMLLESEPVTNPLTAAKNFVNAC